MSANLALAANGDQRVIASALREARQRGLDQIGQTRYAVSAVLTVRPDLTPSDVARSVEQVLGTAI